MTTKFTSFKLLVCVIIKNIAQKKKTTNQEKPEKKIIDRSIFFFFKFCFNTKKILF